MSEKGVTLSSDCESEVEKVQRRKFRVEDFLKSKDPPKKSIALPESSGDESGSSMKSNKALRKERRAARVAAKAAPAAPAAQAMEIEEASLKRRAEEAEDERNKENSKSKKERQEIDVMQLNENEGRKANKPRAEPSTVVIAPDHGAGKPGASRYVINKVNDIISELEGIKRGVFPQLVAAPECGVKFLEAACKYESLILRLVAENEKLKGRLEATKVTGVKAPVVATRQSKEVGTSLGVPLGIDVSKRPSFAQVESANKAAATIVAQPVKKVVPKPKETWSVIVTGAKDETSSEVKKKVCVDVGPALGVRIDKIKPNNDGSVTVSCPSSAERDKVLSNKRFQEIGLKAQAKSSLKRLTVFNLEKLVSKTEFLKELRDYNLDFLTEEEFGREVRLLSEWKVEAGTTNLTLECSARVCTHLLSVGRVYIKIFSCIIREKSPVNYCFKCLGLDHLSSHCRHKGRVCGRCGQSGHEKRRCSNAIHCRDCDLRGHAAGHFMLSMECPVFAAAVDRRRAQH